MHTTLLKQIDDAIRQTIDWQGFTLDSINVSPDTYIAICDHAFAVNHGMSWMPERYKGNKLNIVHDMRAPFSLNVSPATTAHSGVLYGSLDRGASFQRIGKVTAHNLP
jgi:hypothetical protein